jgi:hypothetical protein
MLEKEVDDVVMALLCSPQNWGSDCVAAFRIYGCAALEEEVTESVVVVYGCPLI